jgi:hypothetical protein
MHKTLGVLTLSFLCLFANIWSAERIAGTIDQVDLLIENLTNEKGHNFGERYYAFNRSSHPVRVSIRVIDSINADDKLVNYTIIAKPLDRVKLGKIIQSDLKKESKWEYTWEVASD